MNPNFGNFQRDRPVKIIRAKCQGGRLMCTVQWHKRADGF